MIGVRQRRDGTVRDHPPNLAANINPEDQERIVKVVGRPVLPEARGSPGCG